MIIIFSGYNQRAIIAFLRALKDCHIENYGIIAKAKNDQIFKTEYKNKVFYVRKKIELDLQEIINAIDSFLQNNNIGKGLVLPSTEALNRFLLENRQIFADHRCIIPLVEKDLYHLISDKISFWELCKENGFCVPQKIEIGDLFERAYVAKPKHYMSKNGDINAPFLVHSEIEHAEFRKKYNANDFFFEEYIIGESFYLLFYFTRTGKCISFSQINYAQQSGGKSILVAESSNIHKEVISQQYQNLFIKNGFLGFVMIELRKKGDAYYMIEANPRLWGPSQLHYDARAKLFENFLYDYGYLDNICDCEINNNVKYFWRGGFSTINMIDSDCVWLSNGKEKFVFAYNEFEKYDIYHRDDTMQIFLDEQLSSRNKEEF